MTGDPALSAGDARARARVVAERGGVREWLARSEGEEGRARDAAGLSTEGKEELGCGSVGPGGEEGVMRLGRWVGFGFSSFFLLSYFVCFPISNTNQTKPI